MDDLKLNDCTDDWSHIPDTTEHKEGSKKESKSKSSIKRHCKEVWAMRKLTRNEARSKKINAALYNLQREMNAFRDKMRKDHMATFMGYCMADVTQTKELQQLLDECIICEEPTKEEIDLMREGKNPWLDEHVSIQGDMLKQNLDKRCVDAASMLRVETDPLRGMPAIKPRSFQKQNRTKYD